jgi:hypothetical protein
MKATKILLSISMICAMLPLVPALTGCPQAVPVVAPAVDLGKCISTEVAAGKSFAEVVLACGGDAVAVTIAILNSSEPHVLGSRAHAEAMSLKMSLASDAGAATNPGK